MRIKSSYYGAKVILSKDPVPEWWKAGPRKWCKYVIGRDKIQRREKKKNESN